MPVGGNRTTNYLDAEACFKLWVQTGSTRNAVERLAQAGVQHPETGKKPTVMGVWVAAIRYMAENPDAARVYLQAAAREYKEDTGYEETPYDFAFSDSEYYSYIIRSARRALGKKSFRQLLEQFPGYASDEDWQYAR